MGKWETCFWFSTFPSALVVGAVEMWESRLLLARFPRGSWKEWEACFWLSTLSTAPAFPQLWRWLCSQRGLAGRAAKSVITASKYCEDFSGEIASRPEFGPGPAREFAAVNPRLAGALAILQSTHPRWYRSQVLALVPDF